MKKSLYTLTIILVLSTISNAQLIRGLGVKVGATFANQDWEYASNVNTNFDPDGRTGLNFGVFAELLDVPLLSIVTELNYVQKGFKTELETSSVLQPDGTGEVVIKNTRLDYLNLSALGKLRINLALISPYVVLGPKLDFEINRSNEISNIDFNKNRVGLLVGVGTELNLPGLNLLAEIIYDGDFNDLYENQNLTVNTSSYNLRFGIMF